jgi:restriction system protein
VAFIVAIIIEIVIDNIIVIGAIAGIVLLIFGIIKFIKRQDLKKQKQLNIHNAIIKGMNEKYEQEKARIEKTKEKLFFDLEKTEDYLRGLKHKSKTEDNSYDPINAISKLQSILKIETIEYDKIWDSFYDYSDYKPININERFKEKIKNTEEIYQPEYFVSTSQNLSEKDKFLTEIERKKLELNQLLKSFYTSSLNSIDKRISELKEKYKQKEDQWSYEQKEFKEIQKQKNIEVDMLKTNYSKKSNNSIAEYHVKVLNEIIYNPNFTKDIIADYNDENQVLIIEYLLPSIEKFPTIKELRYVKTRDEYKEINFSERELDKLYDDVIYRIVLDSMNVSFRSDFSNLIIGIVFNGWSNAINKATGLYNKDCILSVFCEKNKFSSINLSEVDPKECFKSLKGISVNKISNLTPIKPIITIENNDKRFVPSQEIGIDSSTNLASMHWEDFEHLIREIFEKEFKTNGGEVKVTQSSRDGGVDAIAYDPDPIRGGKIVIQAKRYTNIVGVSSVRDLYGTVMNEGATKGILVTTSDFGSDSFNFAKDKPITLINGSNLLYLLEKHGYNARINIKEAKDELK